MPLRAIERVLYFEAHIVVDPGLTPLERGQLLTEEDYLNSVEQYGDDFDARMRSEEHTSELKSLMRTSYAVFCLKKRTSKPIIRASCTACHIPFATPQIDNLLHRHAHVPATLKESIT